MRPHLLAMIAASTAMPPDPAGLRRRHGLSLKGATLKEVNRIAMRSAFASRPLRVDLDELGLLKTPCILHLGHDHFVVLKSVGRNGAVIHDPAWACGCWGWSSSGGTSPGSPSS
jgi:ATP-binding cassette subfamily B protein RaxB